MTNKIFIIVAFLCCLLLILSIFKYEQMNEEVEERIADKARPEPSHKPLFITADVKKIELKDSYFNVTTSSFKDDKPPVVYLSNNVYHTEYCKIYAEETNEDYSSPMWLTEVIFDYAYCPKCFTEEFIATYKEAIYITEKNNRDSYILFLQFVTLSGFAIILLLLCHLSNHEDTKKNI